ncbi:hypothetical protein HY413_02545 [Candidatus Kaiserbacteria bacterium]|nr:hypothetical protein [Candidatus Kaiserbacteria bacterium]
MAAKRARKQRTGFDELNDKLDRVIDVISDMATKDDIARLDAKFERKFNGVMNAIDGLTKAVSDLTLEYAAVKMQLSRHEERIRLLEERAGVKLPS